MRALVVEDEARLREGLRDQLVKQGFTVDVAADGEEGLFAGKEYPLDIAIIDLGLPKLSGLDLIRKPCAAAGKKFPILILTARDRWQDKVEGLQAGADDYVAKPYHFEEVLARMQALLRRAGGWASPILECGPIRLDTRAQAVTLERRADRAHHFRIPHPRAHDAARRRRDLEDRAHRAPVRPGLRARQQRHRSVHRPPAPQARSRRNAAARSKPCADAATASLDRSQRDGAHPGA